MNWLWLFFLPIILLIVYVYFSRPCDREFNRIVELDESQHFQEAYDSLQHLSKNKYALLVGYSDKILTCKAFCLLNLSCDREAIEIYDRLLKKIPDVEGNRNWLNQIHFFRGAALYSLEQYEQAIACFDCAIKYKQDNPNVWYFKARALSSLEQFQDAINHCDRALEIQPQDFHTWLLKAHTLYKLKDYQNAMVNCEYVLQNQPKNDLGWQLKAMILYELRDYQQAILACDRALKHQPDYTFALYGKACCYASLGNIELASEILQQIVDLKPQTYRDLFNTNEGFVNIKQNQRFQELLSSIDEGNYFIKPEN